MAINATAIWRVRPSGSNTNGAGFDCSLSSSATGSNGVISGTNTFTDTTAAAFTSGMTGSAISITGVGQFKFTFVSATVGTLTIGAGGTLQPIGANGVKFAWTMGLGQDYSQQNTAQATGTVGTASGTTTFTDAGGAFTSAMVGNALWIASGLGFTTGAYFITAFGSTTSVTLDRSPGTGSAASWAVGGGWADFWTNTATTPVAGDVIYTLGSGVPNPSSYTYDYTAPSFVPAASSLMFTNDPGTPGYIAPPSTVGGMPVIKFTGAQIFQNISPSHLHFNIQGMWFVGAVGVAAGSTVSNNTGDATDSALVNTIGCVLDQFGFDICLVKVGSGTNPGQTQIIGCEVFSSTGGTGGANYAIETAQTGSSHINVYSCNIHDCVGGGIRLDTTSNFFVVSMYVSNCIISKCSGNGIYIDAYIISNISGNTIDANTGNGIEFAGNVSTGNLGFISVYNNIISNHVTASTSGINCVGGSPLIFGGYAFFDYNTYFNNTTNLLNLVNGPHDTQLNSTPYVAQSTENYTLF